MKYFEFDTDGNLYYSYYNVVGSVLADYVNSEGIIAYLEDEVFEEDVKNSYSPLGIMKTKSKAEKEVILEKKKKKVGDWLIKMVDSYEKGYLK